MRSSDPTHNATAIRSNLRKLPVLVWAFDAAGFVPLDNWEQLGPADRQELHLHVHSEYSLLDGAAQLEKITELVASGEEEGAEIYQPPCRLPEKGYWFVPTVFTNVARMSVSSRPQVESTPGRGGTTTVGMSSSSASRQACSGPAPPKASKTKSRGS